MAGIAQNGHKCLILIVVSLQIIENVKEMETNINTQSIKNIHKLKWFNLCGILISLIHCLFIVYAILLNIMLKSA